MKNKTSITENPQHDVKLPVSGFFSSIEYNMLRNNKGKQKAYVKGWEAGEKGLSTKYCPYQPKIKDLVPTDPYYKAWHSGYESFLNNR